MNIKKIRNTEIDFPTMSNLARVRGKELQKKEKKVEEAYREMNRSGILKQIEESK